MAPCTTHSHHLIHNIPKVLTSLTIYNHHEISYSLLLVAGCCITSSLFHSSCVVSSSADLPSGNNPLHPSPLSSSQSSSQPYSPDTLIPNLIPSRVRKKIVSGVKPPPSANFISLSITQGPFPRWRTHIAKKVLPCLWEREMQSPQVLYCVSAIFSF